MGVEFAIVTHDGRVSICAHLDPDLVRDGDALAHDLEESFAQLASAKRRADRRRREVDVIEATPPARRPQRCARPEPSAAKRSRSATT
jgi:hypothetical protein